MNEDLHNHGRMVSALRTAGQGLRFMVKTLLMLMGVMLAMAGVAYLLEFDPEGDTARHWLEHHRAGLFAWRLMLYGGIGWLWVTRVRGQLLARSAMLNRIQRVEWLVLLLIVTAELVGLRPAMR